MENSRRMMTDSKTDLLDNHRGDYGHKTFMTRAEREEAFEELMKIERDFNALIDGIETSVDDTLSTSQKHRILQDDERYLYENLHADNTKSANVQSSYDQNKHHEVVKLTSATHAYSARRLNLESTSADDIETTIATYDQLLLGIDDKLKQVLQSEKFSYRTDSSSEDDLALDVRFKQVQEELAVLKATQNRLRRLKKHKPNLSVTFEDDVRREEDLQPHQRCRIPDPCCQTLNVPVQYYSRHLDQNHNDVDSRTLAFAYANEMTLPTTANSISSGVTSSTLKLPRKRFLLDDNHSSTEKHWLLEKRSSSPPLRKYGRSVKQLDQIKNNTYRRQLISCQTSSNQSDPRMNLQHGSNSSNHSAHPELSQRSSSSMSCASGKSSENARSEADITSSSSYSTKHSLDLSKSEKSILISMPRKERWNVIKKIHNLQHKSDEQKPCLYPQLQRRFGSLATLPVQTDTIEALPIESYQIPNHTRQKLEEHFVKFTMDRVNFSFPLERYDLALLKIEADLAYNNYLLINKKQSITSTSCLGLSLLYDIIKRGKHQHLQPDVKKLITAKQDIWFTTSFKMFTHYQQTFFKFCDKLIQRGTKRSSECLYLSKIEHKIKVLFPQFYFCFEVLVQVWNWKSASMKMLVESNDFPTSSYVPSPNVCKKEVLNENDEGIIFTWLDQVFPHHSKNIEVTLVDVSNKDIERNHPSIGLWATMTNGTNENKKILSSMMEFIKRPTKEETIVEIMDMLVKWWRTRFHKLHFS